MAIVVQQTGVKKVKNVLNCCLLLNFCGIIRVTLITVKPAVAANSIKRDPPLSGHFRAPRTILNANAPLLSVHLSNAASGRRNSPQNNEIVSSNGQFLCVDAASFD